MAETAYTRLGSVLKLERAPTNVHPEEVYPNIGIYSYGRGAFRKPEIKGGESSAKQLYKVREKQFIYSRLFAFEGAYALVPKDFDGHFVSNEFPTFTCDENYILPEYLEWLFKTPHVWEEISAKGKGMGDRRKRVHPDDLLSYEICLPTLTRQREVVNYLEKMQKGLDVRSERAKFVSQSIRSLMSKSFYKATEEAEWLPMRDVAPLVRRPVTAEPDSEYYELGVRSFGRGTFHKPKIAGTEIGSKRIFEIRQGDLLFNIVFAWEGAIAVAQTEDDRRVGSHRFLTCVPDEKLCDSEFLRFFFLTEDGLRKLGEASPGGAGRNRTLGLKKLEEIRVPVPSKTKREWFNKLQANAKYVIDRQYQVSRDAKVLLPNVLSRLFA